MTSLIQWTGNVCRWNSDPPVRAAGITMVPDSVTAEDHAPSGTGERARAAGGVRDDQDATVDALQSGHSP
ncbi:MAG: hypothetical protein JWM61_2600 [Micrococcaceae bacterium]|nr:hypothetical protein [Micrococcaceae bacterium]